MVPTSYLYKTLVMYLSFYELKNIPFTAFHTDHSYQISDIIPILAADFVPHFLSYPPSNYAVIIMLVITSLAIWCEKAQ